MQWNEDLLRLQDEKALRERLAQVIAAGETLAALRRKAAEAALRRLETDALQAVRADLLTYGQQYARLSEDLAGGGITAGAMRRLLHEHWVKLDRPEVQDALRPMFQDLQREQDGSALDRVQALFGKDALRTPWEVRHAWFGEYVYTLVRDPGTRKPNPRPDEETGRVQQGLDGTPAPPITDCSSSFDLPGRTVQTADGPGFSIINVSAGPGGNFSTFSGAVLAVLGGVGVQTQAAVGRSLSLPKGYSKLTLRATIDYRCLLYGHLLGLGVSTASAELFVQILVDNGPSERVALPLGALVAPVAWGAEWRQSDQVVLSASVTLPPNATRARLYAGAVSSAATGGLALTAACNASTSGTVLSLCADLS
jgi:hypothetical protein